MFLVEMGSVCVLCSLTVPISPSGKSGETPQHYLALLWPLTQYLYEGKRDSLHFSANLYALPAGTGFDLAPDHHGVS